MRAVAASSANTTLMHIDRVHHACPCADAPAQSATSRDSASAALPSSTPTPVQCIRDPHYCLQLGHKSTFHTHPPLSPGGMRYKNG